MKTQNSVVVPVLLCTTAVLVVVILIQADTIHTMKAVPTYKIENLIVQERTNIPELHQVYEPRTPIGFKLPNKEQEETA